MIINNFNKKKQRSKFSDEINITPVVDVMLVLLIVFMISSPSLMSYFDVNLPSIKVSNETNTYTDAGNGIEITLLKGNKLFLLDKSVTKNQLYNKLIAISRSGNSATKKVVLCADSKLLYKDIVTVMELIQKAGFKKISLIVSPEKNV